MPCCWLLPLSTFPDTQIVRRSEQSAATALDTEWPECQPAVDPMTRRLLVVDDDSAVRRSLSQTLAEEGYDVRVAESGEHALNEFRERPPDVVLSDVRMPGIDGIDLLKLLRERAPSVDVILMTAYEDMATVARAMREGAFDFLVKPLELGELRVVLERVFEDRRAREQARRAAEEEAEAYRLDTLVGRDPHMIEIYKLVGQVAASRVNVLIRGDTGTGKEMVARAIHYNSPGMTGPFIPLNCTALPESLLESELFGHIRGAFTGAVSDRRGRFALAGRGTIFLDEVGDTTPGFQAKLLRVLEDREFYPLGAERAESTEARVIAATHRDLEELIRDGRFREDLYYRLRVVEIHVPSLRQRVEDIPLLARHFVRKASEELHRPEPALPQSTVNALLQHDWPGNVRELENCLIRAVVLSTGEVIRPETLGLGTLERPPSDVFPTLEEVERAHVERALVAAEGNKTRAAKILAISKPRLYRLIERHGIG